MTLDMLPQNFNTLIACHPLFRLTKHYHEYANNQIIYHFHFIWLLWVNSDQLFPDVPSHLPTALKHNRTNFQCGFKESFPISCNAVKR